MPRGRRRFKDYTPPVDEKSIMDRALYQDKRKQTLNKGPEQAPKSPSKTFAKALEMQYDYKARMDMRTRRKEATKDKFIHPSPYSKTT